MLTCLRKDSLCLDGKLALLILQIEEGGGCGQTVFDCNHDRISGSRHRFTQIAGFNAQHISSHSHQEALVMHAQTQIGFRRLAIQHIVGRLRIWTGGQVLHLPDTSGRQSDIFAQARIHLHHRRTVEGTKRRTGGKRYNIAYISCHRVPCLTKRQINTGIVLTT